MKDLAHTVAKLQAVEEIRQLKARYARRLRHGLQPRRHGAASSPRTPSGTAARFGRYEGVDAICGFFAGVSSQITLGAPLHDRAGRSR